MHKPFSLYKRPTTKKNKQIYYCQFYDESGNRLTARSTGQTSKAAAENWALLCVLIVKDSISRRVQATGVMDVNIAKIGSSSIIGNVLKV